MERIELPPFYVGQIIVAIVNHSQGLFKIGDEFTVKELKNSCCYGIGVSIGIKQSYNGHAAASQCRLCKSIFMPPHKYVYFMASCFAPKQQSYPLMTFEKIKQKEFEKLEPEILISN